jgi:hypothetical protein
MSVNFPTPPKLLKWSRNLDQHYHTDQQILVTAGCSFTASTTQFECPASWPGYVLDRCGFDHCVDLSYPGVGNEFIANSILNYVEELDPNMYCNILIMICWSGPSRKEELGNLKDSVQIDGVSYNRTKSNQGLDQAETWRSWKNIIFTQNYLENKKIKFGFSLYCNVVEPMLLPRRDLTTDFATQLTPHKNAQLKNCTWIHDPKDSIFEFCFLNDDCLADDMFHPTAKGSLMWTDQVLLPGLAATNLITPK